MKVGEQYKYIPVVVDTEEEEVGKYTELYTDIGTFEILMPLEDLKKELKKVGEGYFKFKKLEEYSAVLEHFGELHLNMKDTKVLGFREHTVIHNRVKQREINAEKSQIAPKK